VLTPHGLRVLVGDVKGKGLEAVRVAAAVLGSFRESAFVSVSLRDLAAELDEGASRHLGDEDFVTAVLVERAHAVPFATVRCRVRGYSRAVGRRRSPTHLAGAGKAMKMGPNDAVPGHAAAQFRDAR